VSELQGRDEKVKMRKDKKKEEKMKNFRILTEYPKFLSKEMERKESPPVIPKIEIKISEALPKDNIKKVENISPRSFNSTEIYSPSSTNSSSVVSNKTQEIKKIEF
jgi:hypothetical protein